MKETNKETKTEVQPLSLYKTKNDLSLGVAHSLRSVS